MRNNNSKKAKALDNIEFRLAFMVEHELIAEKDALALMEYITINVSKIKEQEEQPEAYSDAIKIWKELKAAREEHHFGDGNGEAPC